MSMACPRCSSTFEERYHCPSCGIPLVAVGASSESGSEIYGRPKWQQTAWGRTVVGLMLAQGLYYGLWQLSTAAVLAALDESARAGWWSTATGSVVQYLLLCISLIAGGMMAGAGQRQSMAYGALLGFLNGLIFLIVPKGSTRQFSDVELYGQPLFQAIVAGVGAWIGSLIWKPMLPLVPTSTPLGTTPAPLGRLNLGSSARPSFTWLSGPVNWTRVLIGTTLAIVGSAWANLILKWILQSDTGFALESQYHAKFVTWEISALALLLGAGLAGTNSRNGLKHGLLTGLGVCAGLIGLFYQSGGMMQPGPSLIFGLLEWDRLIPLEPTAQKIVATCLVVMALALIGGWFGSQLLPPLAPKRSRKDSSFPALA